MIPQNVPQRLGQHLFQITHFSLAGPSSKQSASDDVQKELALLRGKIAAIEKLLEIDLSRSMAAFQ